MAPDAPDAPAAPAPEPDSPAPAAPDGAAPDPATRRAAAMAPFGRALLAHLGGNESATLVMRRDDGLAVPLPASHFFRRPDEFTAIESAALARCRGHVLDVGAGSGLHALALLARGRRVTALDVSPEAVEVMARRGVPDVRCADFLSFRGGPFDTLLFLGHGIGIAEHLAGLGQLLEHARGLVGQAGAMLVDSSDPAATGDPAHLAYHAANRQAGRYIGETRLEFEFAGRTGVDCGWLLVDAETLARVAARAGWECETVLRGDGGEYLARLAIAHPG